MTYKELYESLLGRSLPEPSGNPNVSTLCPFHDDHSNSCSINLQSGAWICHTGTCGNGGPAQFVAKIRGVPLSDAYKLLQESELDTAFVAKTKDTKPIPTQIRDTFARALVHNKERTAFALKKLGWTPETIKHFGVGLHEETGRYTIPIYDEAGELRNIRMYHPESSGLSKMISYATGHGEARLFPIESRVMSTIIVCEGEKDCILANQYARKWAPGWAAITGTGGAGSWRKEWNESFDGKDVYIIYDRDEAGKEGAERVASNLVHHAREVRVVILDITEPKGADLTNYFLDSGKGWDDLKTLIDETEPFTPSTKRTLRPMPVDEEVYNVHLSEASDHRWDRKRVRMKVMVAGKDLQPYWVPRKVTFVCDKSMGKMCATCAMDQSNAVIQHEVDETDPALIELVRRDPNDQIMLIKGSLGIAKKCPRVQHRVEQQQHVEELTLVPEIEFSDLEREYVSRLAYAPFHGVRANRAAVVEAVSLPAPKTSSVVHWIRKMEDSRSSLDTFKMDDQKKGLLKIFQPADGQTVAEKFQEIAWDLTHNVTRIYGREDLIKAVDLCYHTVISFEFQRKKVAKAWGDILIIGDTRTGKTETIEELIFHYKLGEMSVGENTSFAGLVGGLKQGANNGWLLTWGRIPLNNKRLLVIDEMSGLSKDIIAVMSGIRSNGVAEIIKIRTERTEARTRLIWLSNPRDSKSMSQYGHGVEAVKHLIGAPEDIARFDLVVTSATNEVPIETINTDDHPEVPHVYTSDLCRDLVLWAWSRKADQIRFTPDATRRCLELATEQSQKYASVPIPLVEGGNHRIKLAKLAVAAACRTFSTADGETVIVRPEHVEFVHDFLDEIYAKSSLDYAGWSQTRLAMAQIDQSAIGETEEWCRDHPDWAEMWLTDNWLRLEDFKTMFDLETKDARQEIFVPLAKLRMIERGKASTYHPTPAFIQTIKKVQAEQLLAGAPKSGYDDQSIPF